MATKSRHRFTDEWNAEVEALVKTGLTYSQAKARVAKEHPALRTMMLKEANQNRPQAAVHRRAS